MTWNSRDYTVLALLWAILSLTVYLLLVSVDIGEELALQFILAPLGLAAVCALIGLWKIMNGMLNSAVQESPQ